MHLTILACDLDGTLATDGKVATETWETLRQAKAAGLILILVTGRTLNTFPADGPFAELCEAIVAENGAVVYFPRRDGVILPFGRLNPELLQRLQATDIPLERGTAIVATHVPHDKAIVNVLREVGGGASVEYNRGAVMVLPPGATKGTGLHYALHELGYSPRNVIACGDAENDRSLFEMAEFSVAVANAAPNIQALADYVLPQQNGLGVQELILNILAECIPVHQARANRRLFLGYNVDGTPAHLDPFTLVDGNLGIFGASISGKSWLAGLLTEELLKLGYQGCIIDPEGDYRGLRALPHSLVVGGPDISLPSVIDVVTFIEYSDINLVLDISAYPLAERHRYVLDLLRALRSLRARRGRPHWFLIDEAQSFCPPQGGSLTDLLHDMMQHGGLSLVSYRPSQVASRILASLDHWALTRLTLPEEIDTLKPLLEKYAGEDEILDKLSTLPLGQVFMCFNNKRWCHSSSRGVIRFRTGPRAVPHIRHLHKYLQAPLPEPKRFYFRDGAGRALGRAAASLWEFREALSDLPLDSLKYHLRRGEFEAWLRLVLRDPALAHRINKISRRKLQDQELRQALSEAVINRYQELDTLA